MYLLSWQSVSVAARSMDSPLLGPQPSLLPLPEHRRCLCNLLTYCRDAASTHVTKLDMIALRNRNVCNDGSKAKWVSCFCFCSALSSSENPRSKALETSLNVNLVIVTRFQSFADLVPVLVPWISLIYALHPITSQCTMDTHSQDHLSILVIYSGIQHRITVQKRNDRSWFCLLWSPWGCYTTTSKSNTENCLLSPFYWTLSMH